MVIEFSYSSMIFESSKRAASGEALKKLTTKQMTPTLPIALAQVKASKKTEDLVN